MLLQPYKIPRKAETVVSSFSFGEKGRGSFPTHSSVHGRKIVGVSIPLRKNGQQKKGTSAERPAIIFSQEPHSLAKKNE